MNRIITARLNSRGQVEIKPRVFQFDHGQILRLEGFDLPDEWYLDLSSGLNGKSITVHGSGNQAEIPDEVLLSGSSVSCWIRIQTSAKGRTLYSFTIPVSRRAMLPTD